MGDKNIENIKRIIGYTAKIQSYCKGLGKEDFLADDKVVEACVFNLIQIGESTSSLDDDFMAAHSSIPWSKIRGLRNRIVHDYGSVDFLLIWDIINSDLGDLIRQLGGIAN
jgi:uncharacterized protein with HEPN domain